MYNLLCDKELQLVWKLPWSISFERFLRSDPSSKEDEQLFVDILNFLNTYLKTKNNGIILKAILNNLSLNISNIIFLSRDSTPEVRITVSTCVF